MGRKKVKRCGSRFTLTEGFESQAETHWHHATKTPGWLFQSGSFFTVGSTAMFPFLCHLPSFPLGFYILLLAWYLPSASVQRIPLSSFSWLTNEMLNLAMLLSLSFIAQLHFLHFTCHSSVITLLLLYLLLYAHHLTGISSFDCYSALLSFPCSLLPSSPHLLLHSSFFYHLTHPVHRSPPMPKTPFQKVNRGQKHFYLKELSKVGRMNPASGVLSLLVNYRSLTRTEQMLHLQRVKCKVNTIHVSYQDLKCWLLTQRLLLLSLQWQTEESFRKLFVSPRIFGSCLTHGTKAIQN